MPRGHHIAKCLHCLKDWSVTYLPIGGFLIESLNDIIRQYRPKPELVWIASEKSNCYELKRNGKLLTRIYLVAKNLKSFWARNKKHWPYDELDRAKKEVEAEFNTK